MNNNIIVVDSRLRNKIESIYGGESWCSVKFKDLADTFWFNSVGELQEFLNVQTRERYFHKTLRKGYFDYTNEYSEVLRYRVNSHRGKLALLSEENLGKLMLN